MATVLIILGIIAAIYGYAAVAQYYAFKNWRPLCGGKGTSCAARNEAADGGKSGTD